MSRLVVVTATTNIDRAVSCIKSWGDVPLIIVRQYVVAANAHTYDTPITYHRDNKTTVLLYEKYLGTVPAFKAGVDYALEHIDADVIACLHDDLEIHDPQWVQKVLDRFDRQPAVGLLGFGGAIGLGDSDIYQKPYAPVQLARIGFRSNLVDAEVHGVRSLLAERVACLDGFSQIGRREFWDGEVRKPQLGTFSIETEYDFRPWHILTKLGLIHHIYDGALGCLAARYGWETWYLPIRCRHLGGQTAVGDEGYQRWAKQQVEGGDHGFWESGHQAVYEAFKDQLPLRV